MNIEKIIKRSLGIALASAMLFNSTAVIAEEQPETVIIQQNEFFESAGAAVAALEECPEVEIPVVFEDIAEPDAAIGQEEIPLEEESEMQAGQLDILLTSRQVAVTPVISSGAELLRVYCINGNGAEVNMPASESGVYMLSAGDYFYDVRICESNTTETHAFAVDESDECMELYVGVSPAQLRQVEFDLWQADTILDVYALDADGNRTVFSPDDAGVYHLPAGKYCYDASLNGYVSITGAGFVVEEAAETQYITVYLVSDERAAVERSANTLVFSVIANGMQQAEIEEELKQLLDELGVVSAEYFYNNKRDDGRYESVYYAILDNDEIWYAVDMLAMRSEIGYAEPEYLYFTSEEGEYIVENAWATGDQSYLQSQPWIEDMEMRSVWGKLESGKVRPGEGTIVAVIDTGVDYTHPDLAPNMWVNTAELNGYNGMDDDGNGYIDDIYGYDFVSDDANPRDDHGHGTHVAGIIAMADNNIGGVGMAYGAKIMAIKAGQATGSFSSASIARAVLYARANGADVINMSFGGYSRSNIVENALQTAFADCVLVAAAGNDGAVTTDAPPTFFPRGDMYPAGYSYVLGVMATDHNGKNLTGFSNWDWLIGMNCEYEMAAPGADIYSTLPGGRYATWSGTSMAAPMVSAAAAIIRSQKGSDSAYSNRYIIGQLVGATTKSASNEYRSYPSLNLLDSLKYVPTPQLSVTGVQLFDSKEFSAANNGDGVWQNGETIELGLEITNRWGAASEISITADGLTSAGDPGFVTFKDSTAAIGAVGTYATANTGYIYDDGLLTGVSDPIRFTIGKDVANGVEIPINIHVTAKNDMDPKDKTVYTAEYTYVLTVENGAVISGILTEDTILTADRMWIIRGSLQVPEGITLTVEPGTHVHFERVFTGNENIDRLNYPFLQVRGTADFNGTEDSPVRLSTDTTFAILGPQEVSDYPINYDGVVMYNETSYSNRIDCTMDYVSIDGNIDVVNGGYYYQGSIITLSKGAHLEIHRCLVVAEEIRSSRFDDCAFLTFNSYYHEIPFALLNCDVRDSIADSPWDTGRNMLEGNVFQGFATIAGIRPFGNSISRIEGNAILNRLSEPEGWFRPTSFGQEDYSLAGNYWGTENEQLIKDIILDSNDNVSYGTITYEPFLTKSSASLEDIYPFVLEAWVEDAEGNRIENIVGAQTCTFHVLFNRDMDTSVQPSVCYGQAEPYNDYRLRGNWVSRREWVATKTINPLIDYGTQYFCIEGAVTADDAWLVTGKDTRLWFNITNVGAEALVLQSYADAQGIHLTWTQDDFETLAGYNIYRSQYLDEEGRPVDAVKINDVLIPSDVLEFTDTNVAEGETYHYYFTVVQTDFNESDGSNISKCTALDMTAPVIVHTPADMAIAGEAIPISAMVTDNVQVESVVLYARAAGSDAWQATSMTNTEGSLFFANITTNAAGMIEYYICASDGVGHAYAASADAPNRVVVRELDILPGDVNMDDSVDIMDLMLVAHSIAGTTTLGSAQAAAADVNADGIVDIFDLMRIAQYVCGIIGSL